MGYDSRLYIVRKTNVPVGDDIHSYAETMAIYEMCVFPPFQKLFNEKCPVTQHSPCEGDNDILLDKYGEPLRERTLEEVLDCLDQIIVLDDDMAHCARIAPLQALLKALTGIQNDWYRLAVLHYGH
jgi:hypothetical protein